MPQTQQSLGAQKAPSNPWTQGKGAWDADVGPGLESWFLRRPALRPSAKHVPSDSNPVTSGLFPPASWGRRG